MPSFIVLHIPHSRTGAGGTIGDLIASQLRGPHLQLDRVWLVHAEETADENRDRLAGGLPPEDALGVLEVGEQAAWGGLTEEQREWILGHV